MSSNATSDPSSTDTIEPAGPTDATGHYEIDPNHSRIGFVVRHAMVSKVRGAFGEFNGSGFFDPRDPANSHLHLTIGAASVDTGNADRDAHLASGDFFETQVFPEIEFRSTRVQRSGTDAYEVTGDLTIKGVTHSVSVEFSVQGPVRDPFGLTRIGLEGSTKVNRKDWGLEWNAALETGGVLVGEQVTLEFDVSAVASEGTD